MPVIKFDSIKNFPSLNSQKYKSVYHIGNKFYVPVSSLGNYKIFLSDDNKVPKYLGLVLNSVPLKEISGSISVVYGYIEKLPDTNGNIFTQALARNLLSVFNIPLGINSILVNIDTVNKTLKAVPHYGNNLVLRYFDTNLYSVSDHLIELCTFYRTHFSIPYFENFILKYRLDYRYMIPVLPYNINPFFNQYKVGSLQTSSVIFSKRVRFFNLLDIIVNMYSPRFFITKPNDNIIYKYDANTNSIIDTGLTRATLTFNDITTIGNTYEEILTLLNNQTILDTFTSNTFVIELLTNGYVLEFYITHDFLNMLADEYIHTKSSLYEHIVIRGIV